MNHCGLSVQNQRRSIESRYTIFDSVEDLLKEMELDLTSPLFSVIISLIGFQPHGNLNIFFSHTFWLTSWEEKLRRILPSTISGSVSTIGVFWLIRCLPLFQNRKAFITVSMLNWHGTLFQTRFKLILSLTHICLNNPDDCEHDYFADKRRQGWKEYK